ncbi:DMT family transporter [Intrasporangium sp.]|uniref:DMT family transporter n=1 Tax=Intrasporangium sp. TaxID=1925024 RepID=UPI0032216B30
MRDRASRPTAALAVAALVAITAVWGSSFAITKDLLTRLPVTDYLALRFLLAALVVGMVRPRLVLRADRGVLLHGVALGGLYFVGQLLQFVGLQYTAATVSAFIVSMYVVFTPLLVALVSRTWPRARTVVASLLAISGVAALSLQGLAIGWGELLTLVAALLYAAHIVVLGGWTSVRSAYPLTVVQLLTMGVCFLAVSARDGITLPVGGDWVAFLYLATVVGGLTMLVQTWAQAHIGAAQVAVLMVLEPVWAAFFGVTFWGEQLAPRVLLGAALVLSGLVIITTRHRRGDRTGPAGPRPAGVRSPGARSPGVRPEGARPEGARPGRAATGEGADPGGVSPPDQGVSPSRRPASS